MSESPFFRTLPEQISHHLRDDLLSGYIAPGAPIRITEVAKRFGVSTGPVRDALRQLAQDGSLVFEPNRGFRAAAKLGAATRPFFVEMRRKIELYSLHDGFNRFDGGVLTRFDEALSKMNDFQPEKGDIRELIRYDMQFHQIIIETGGDKDLLSIWQSILVRVIIDYSRRYNARQMHRQFYEEHVRIYDAIVAGDREAAGQLLARNIV